MIRITCLGGVGSVTGSCYLVENSAGMKVLVDCGLFQGGSQFENRNWGDWGFDPKELRTLFLTHAHIDHSGRIPKLVKDGFTGRILTSPPTAELCQIMLLDSAHIQEMDAEWQNRKNKRQAKNLIMPLYTTEDAEAALALLSPVERDQIMEIEPGVKARLRNAGHILGSCILELWIENDGVTSKIVFSGDLGKKNQLIVKDPHEVFDADFLFIESTYGNRQHRSLEESKKELLEAIRFSVSHDEKIMIPAFAVERTQEILYLLGEFHRTGLLPDIPIYLDSPLAIKATRIFRKNKKYYDIEARAIVEKGFDPFDMPNLIFTETTKESISINEKPGSAIIIAGNGMCTAGRIKHHLKHNLWREGASLVIVGFQAGGTTGRKIVDGTQRVKIFGENVAVKATVFTIGGLSAHADQKDLLDWIANFESGPSVFVVHGETQASKTLADKIRSNFNFEVRIPTWKERLILKPKEIAFEEAVEGGTGPDPQILALNALIDIENTVKELRNQIKSGDTEPRIIEDAVSQLKFIQEELETLFP